MKLKPLADRYLVLPDAEETITHGGIIIPDTAKEKSTMGVIVAVGTDLDDELPIGTKVLYSKYAGLEYEEDGKKYMLLREIDCIAQVIPE